MLFKQSWIITVICVIQNQEAAPWLESLFQWKVVDIPIFTYGPFRLALPAIVNDDPAGRARINALLEATTTTTTEKSNQDVGNLDMTGNPGDTNDGSPGGDSMGPNGDSMDPDGADGGSMGPDGPDGGSMGPDGPGSSNEDFGGPGGGGNQGNGQGGPGSGGNSGSSQGGGQNSQGGTSTVSKNCVLDKEPLLSNNEPNEGWGDWSDWNCGCFVGASSCRIVRTRLCEDDSFGLCEGSRFDFPVESDGNYNTAYQLEKIECEEIAESCNPEKVQSGAGGGPSQGQGPPDGGGSGPPDSGGGPPDSGGGLSDSGGGPPDSGGGPPDSGGSLPDGEGEGPPAESITQSTTFLGPLTTERGSSPGFSPLNDNKSVTHLSEVSTIDDNKDDAYDDVFDDFEYNLVEPETNVEESDEDDLSEYDEFDSGDRGKADIPEIDYNLEESKDNDADFKIETTSKSTTTTTTTTTTSTSSTTTTRPPRTRRPRPTTTTSSSTTTTASSNIKILPGPQTTQRSSQCCGFAPRYSDSHNLIQDIEKQASKSKLFKVRVRRPILSKKRIKAIKRTNVARTTTTQSPVNKIKTYFPLKH